MALYLASTADNDEVSVDVASVGICGSDLHHHKDGGVGSALIKEPFVPGHEFPATLQQDIETLELNGGQLVAVDPVLPCHNCEWRHRDHHDLCPHVVFLDAPPNHNALTQSSVVPTQSIIALPLPLSADQGAMLEPTGVSIHALNSAKPRLMESVLVLGCGAIGLGIIQLLKRSTACEIIAIDPQVHLTNATLPQCCIKFRVQKLIELYISTGGGPHCTEFLLD